MAVGVTLVTAQAVAAVTRLPTHKLCNYRTIEGRGGGTRGSAVASSV